jgi:RpiB/LacA/LacB family sugar-phosphate isomerase
MKKYNLLIPMAGAGSRFAESNYIMPKQLIMVDGTQMLDWSLKSIIRDDCNLIFAVRREHISNFSIDTILKSRYGNDIKIVVVNELTDGSVSTCLLAKEYINNDEPLLIYTLDVFFEPFFNPSDLPDSDGFLLTFKSNSDGYSYAQLDDNGYVTKTAEKEVISENAAVGVYGYKSGKMFVKYAEKMISENIRTKGEFYVCPLYNLMIEDGLTVTTEPVEKMHLMGTPSELEFFTSHTLKRFGKKPISLCSDHSGYELKEEAKDVLEKNGLEYIDFGTFVNKDCDYNDYVSQAVEFIYKGDCDFALAFCRTGQGVNISGNKRKGIRGALTFDEYTAEHSIRHNCANFLSIPSKYVDKNLFDKMIKIWKKTTFDGGRHMNRIQKVESYENI